MDKEEIVAIAREHDGMYLLPRRFGGPRHPKDERDLKYDACQSLVDERRARWLSGNSRPGIQIVRD